MHYAPYGDLKFASTAVAFRLDDDVEAECLVLAERPDGSGRSLEVHRGVADSEDDARLGFDTYCLVLDGGATHCGGIERWTATGETLSLQLTSAGAEALGAESILVALVPTGTQQAVVAALDHLIDREPRPDDFTIVAAHS